jgi:hypothetical protein
MSIFLPPFYKKYYMQMICNCQAVEGDDRRDVGKGEEAVSSLRGWKDIPMRDF